MKNNKLRVLHVIKTLSLGGAEVNLFNLSQAIDTNKFEIHIGYSYGGEFEIKFKQLGVRLFKYANTAYKVKSLASLIIIFRILRYIFKNKIQIVHTHNFNAHVWGGIAARLSGVKVIEHVHDYRYEEPLYLEKRGVRPDQFRLAKYFAKLSDSIVVLTKNNKNLLLRNRIASDRKIKMLLNGINPKFNQSVDGYELRKKHCIPADRRIIFAAARISQEKNIGAVIDIAEISVQRCDKVIFVIAGDGPLKNELEENVKKRNLDNIVRFIGFCPNVKEFLKISNIFIQPTLLELHSITMIEAMSMGVPVLVSQGVGCNDYFITHGENGFLLDPYKPEVWAQTINLLLDNQSLSNTIGNAGSKLIENECDIKKTVKNIENLYYDLVSTM